MQRFAFVPGVSAEDGKEYKKPPLVCKQRLTQGGYHAKHAVAQRFWSSPDHKGMEEQYIFDRQGEIPAQNQAERMISHASFRVLTA